MLALYAVLAVAPALASATFVEPILCPIVGWVLPSFCKQPQQCQPSKCPAPSYGWGICKSDNTCGFNCQSGWQPYGNTCVPVPPQCQASKCPGTSNGFGICNGNSCDIGCNSGYTKSGNTCVPIPCDPSKCPGTSYGFGVCNANTNSCDIGCNNGYTKSGNTCVPTPCDPTKCPGTSFGFGICNANTNSCDIGCNNGYTKSGNTCIPTPCDVTKCPCPANGSALCSSSNTCDFTCNAGYTKSGSTCSPNPPPPTTTTTSGPKPTSCPGGGQSSSFAFYQGYQSLAPGNAAVAAQSADECAGLCIAAGCASFDFWSEGGKTLCGLQVGGGGFDQFQALSGVVHGVPGDCTSLSPSIKSASKKCTTRQECPASQPPPPVTTPTTTAGPTTTAAPPTTTAPTTTSTPPAPSNCPGSGIPAQAFALYNGWQTLAPGNDAVPASSVDDCAAICLSTYDCVSFDFWDGQYCGIQVGGGGFDQFQPLAGVVHGVPGNCNTLAGECANADANKVCQTAWECPRQSSKLMRHRRSHGRRHA